jgi:hypothetical protein
MKNRRIKIIWRELAGKNEPTQTPIFPRFLSIAVKSMAVMQAEEGVQDAPRQNDRPQREKEMHSEMATHLILVDADQESHGKQRGAGRDDNKDENNEAATFL